MAHQHTLSWYCAAYAGYVPRAARIGGGAARCPARKRNKTLVGLAMGIYGLTQALLQLPLGIKPDKFGARKPFMSG